MKNLLLIIVCLVSLSLSGQSYGAPGVVPKGTVVKVDTPACNITPTDSAMLTWLTDSSKRALAINELKNDFELLKDAKSDCNGFWCWFWVIIKILSGTFFIALVNWLVRLIPSKSKYAWLPLRLFDLIGLVGKFTPNKAKNGLNHDKL